MRNVHLIIILCFVFLSLNGQTNMRIKISERNRLVQKIIPFAKVNWCYYKSETFKIESELIFSSGEVITLDTVPPHGFINKGHHSFTHEFITYMIDSTKHIVYTPDSFSDFLGKIDNVEEAILYLESQELEYVFYQYEPETQSFKVVYDESSIQIVLQARFVPWIKQNTSIYYPDEELSELEKKTFEIVLNKNTKKIKIKE